ncbi:hypothetical protein HPB52_018637 [Rhipicephalus sanguineus]|uniref:Uncharacterized protein n=1 Tax=Rhipicephalus sanguineus TaxID=34632 RepID=A0A9D4QAN0_RHISA|nr:hypothetical protein HPB52_018637 [Rhipicephalus sanguineus]
MKKPPLTNTVTRAALARRISDKRKPHVRYSGVDPDIGTEEFVSRLNHCNPQLQLNGNTCRVRTLVRERSGTSAIIVEVDLEAFVRVLRQPRIFVGWASVRASEHLHVPTCTFCAQYGHGRSSCPVRNDAARAVRTRMRCGTEGPLDGGLCCSHGGPRFDVCPVYISRHVVAIYFEAETYTFVFVSVYAPPHSPLEPILGELAGVVTTAQ